MQRRYVPRPGIFFANQEKESALQQPQPVFIAPEGLEPDFIPHYERYIWPLTQEFEQKRLHAINTRKQRKKKAIPSFIVFFIIMVILGLSVSADSDTSDIFFYIILIAGAMLLIWCNAPIHHYKSTVKQQIYPHIFSFIGNDFRYHAHGLLSVSSLKPSAIIPNYDKEKKEDYVTGSYKGVKLECTEARLITISRDSKGRKYNTTVFNGIFILLSMNKHFSGKTIVKRDGGRIGNWLYKAPDNLKNVKLEDPVFEKQFQVYGSDQVEARYLLTTSFMERLLELSELFGKNTIQCSFYDNHLLLMIASNENRFETGDINKPATFVHEINTVLNEMRLIFQIIDILKLDQKTRL